MNRQLRLNRDLIFLFSATSFLNGYMQDSKVKTKELLNLQNKLIIKSAEYKKYSKSVEQKGIKFFEETENELREIANQEVVKKFTEKIIFDEEQDIVADGLYFTLCLILEHGNLENKRLFLPYKEAKKLYEKINVDFTANKNSRIIAKHFTDKVMKEYK